MYLLDSFLNLAATEYKRQVDVRSAPHEARRHHSNYGANLVVQVKLAPNHGGIAAEFALPEFITKHRYRFRSGHAVGHLRRPSDQGEHSHDVERVHGAMIASQALRVAGTGPHHVADGGCDHTFERGVALRQIEELIHGVISRAPVVGTDYRDTDQPVHFLVRKWIQDNAVNHAVHGGAAANAQC